MHHGYHPHLGYATRCSSPARTHKKTMADRNRFSVKEKDKVENKANHGKEKGKEKSLKKTEKPVKKAEKPAEQPKVEAEKKNQENIGAAVGGEVNKSEEKEDFQPIELPPFEIVTG